MKKAKTFIKNNIKLLIGFIIGIIISAGGVYAAIVIQGTSVGYTDNYSLGATTVQAAIDALYNKTKLGNDSKFIEAYTYNQTSGASNYCVTGNESTCVATTCYKTKSANSCPAGTIIRYKVSPGNVVTFHEMYDDASTITMQSQRNTIYNVPWISVADYGSSPAKNDKGPLTVLPALEKATAGWVNVNNQTYTMGTTVFKTNAYTGCGTSSCTENDYTLSSRTAKARMITGQETMLFGCAYATKSCPIWMYNYLHLSASNGGTENDKSTAPTGAAAGTAAYWTMSGYGHNNTTVIKQALSVLYTGQLGGNSTTYREVQQYQSMAARAVVVVNKP